MKMGREVYTDYSRMLNNTRVESYSQIEALLMMFAWTQFNCDYKLEFAVITTCVSLGKFALLTSQVQRFCVEKLHSQLSFLLFEGILSL